MCMQFTKKGQELSTAAISPRTTNNLWKPV